jgi:two-component system phosphate regulon sensor histidine kinase PhoR
VIGLSIVQYQYLRIGLNLAKIQFNQKIALAIKEIKEDLHRSNELTFLVGKTITKDDSYFKLSMDSVKDASSYFMNDFLRERLLQQGIKADFTYNLYAKDSTDYLRSPNMYNRENSLLKYQIELTGYLPIQVKKRLILELQFKNLNKYFLFQLNGLTIPGLIFIAVIIFVIIWVLKSFYWQKNLITITNEFINNLTHELKTPVFSIGLASKILQDKTEGENKELVGMIRRQVDKLKNQIEKVLDLASLKDKKNFIEKKVIDFKPVILNLIKDFDQLAKIEEFSFVDRVKGEEYLLKCDAYHLENAINSLLDNAKKYGNEKIEIVFEAYKEMGRLIISVKDKGIGIADEDKKRIFEKYFRVSSGDLHNVKGYGLGLNYVKRIIRMHKGKIIVKSVVGKGSEFIISLPIYKNGK